MLISEKYNVVTPAHKTMSVKNANQKRIRRLVSLFNQFKNKIKCQTLKHFTMFPLTVLENKPNFNIIIKICNYAFIKIK